MPGRHENLFIGTLDGLWEFTDHWSLTEIPSDTTDVVLDPTQTIDGRLPDAPTGDTTIHSLAITFTESRTWDASAHLTVSGAVTVTAAPGVLYTVKLVGRTITNVPDEDADSVSIGISVGL